MFHSDRVSSHGSATPQRHKRGGCCTGFTLVELMVVIVIIGLLATVASLSYFKLANDAKIEKAKADISQFKSGLNLFAIKKGAYPASLDELVSSGLMESIPRDPWKNDYEYNKTGSSGKFEVRSYGPDGSPGTDDDINSWELDKEYDGAK